MSMKSIILISIVCMILITKCEMKWTNSVDDSSVNSDVSQQETETSESSERFLNKRLIEFKRFIEFKRNNGGVLIDDLAANKLHKRPSIGARTRSLSKSTQNYEVNK